MRIVRRRCPFTATAEYSVRVPGPDSSGRGFITTLAVFLLHNFISQLPKDLMEKLLRAKDEGRIDSVSGYIADLLRHEDDWRDARATLDRIFERCPDPEAKHYAWARQVLGVGPKPAA